MDVNTTTHISDINYSFMMKFEQVKKNFNSIINVSVNRISNNQQLEVGWTQTGFGFVHWHLSPI